MLIYPDHLQNWLAFRHVLLIFVILASFWLSKTGRIWGFWEKQIEFGVSWYFWRTHGRNDLKFGMLIYPDHLHILLHFRHDLLIFPIMAPFRLWNESNVWVSCHFLGNTWREWPEIYNANVSWPPSELIRFGYSQLIFVIVAPFWLREHFRKNTWEKCPEICHADVSWRHSELIRFCSRSVDFPSFGVIFTN